MPTLAAAAFTISERVAIAEAVAERLQGRQLANLKQNRVRNISHSEEQGRTTDLALSHRQIRLPAKYRYVLRKILLPCKLRIACLRRYQH